MATINMHMKFEIEIPKQTWLMLRKPCRLQTDGQTDRRTDKLNPVYPPSNFVGRGYNDVQGNWCIFTSLGLNEFIMMKSPWNSQSLSQKYSQQALHNLPGYGQSLNSLWPNDVIWRHKYGSTLPQVMAWCHAAPSHYLNQCWLSSVKSNDTHLRTILPLPCCTQYCVL